MATPASSCSGACTSNPAKTTVKPEASQLAPMTEKGHRGGIKGVESDAKGMQGGLAPGSMKEGGGSHFGMAKTEGGDSRSGMEKEEGGEKEGNGASV